jgi:hypothetical protein
MKLPRVDSSARYNSVSRGVTFIHAENQKPGELAESRSAAITQFQAAAAQNRPTSTQQLEVR